MSLTKSTHQQSKQDGAKSPLISSRENSATYQSYHEPEEKAEQPSGPSNEATPCSNTQSSNDTYGLADVTASFFIIWFFIYAVGCLVYFIMTVINEGETNSDHEKQNGIYYIGLIVYQIAVIVVSIWSYVQLSALPKSDTNPEWYQLIFYAKFLSCSVYNVITGILLSIGLSDGLFKVPDESKSMCLDLPKYIWMLLIVSHFLNVFSIPIPGVVLFKYLNTKKVIISMDKTLSLRNGMIFYLFDEICFVYVLFLYLAAKKRTESVSPSNYSSAELNVRENVFNDKYMLTGICSAYFAHLLIYILTPAIAKRKFNTIMRVTYGGNTDLLFDINQIVLRAFQGMCLNGLFFIFFLSVLKKDYEPYYVKDGQKMSDWKRVKLLIRRNLLYWLIWILVIMTLIIIRLLGVIFEDKTINIVIQWMCYFWIAMNGLGIFVIMFYIFMFRGVIRKYTKRKHSVYGTKHPNNTGYVLRAFLLCILFIIQIACVINHDDVKRIDRIRLSMTAAFAVIQMVTLIELRKVQSNDAYSEWLGKKRCINRERNMKWWYFRFLILLNMVNLIYVFSFGMKYYEKGKLIYELESDQLIRISYAMSFSSAAIFIISLTQLITSYADFDDIINKRGDTVDISTTNKENEVELSVQSNSQPVSAPAYESKRKLLV